MFDRSMVESEKKLGFWGSLTTTRPVESSARAKTTSFFAARIAFDTIVSEKLPLESVLNGAEYARNRLGTNGEPTT